MLDYIAQANRPILLSTGMSDYDDIRTCINILEKNEKKRYSIISLRKFLSYTLQAC